MAFCRKCGNKIADNAKFCGRCGTLAVTAENQTVTPKAQDVENISETSLVQYESEPIPQQIQLDLDVVAVQEEQPKLKRNKGFFKVAIACIIVLAVLGGGAYGFFVFGMPLISYNKANELFKNGNYDESVSIFDKLGDYKNSNEFYQKAVYEKAVKLVNDGNYTEALNTFDEIYSYAGVDDKIKEVHFKIADTLADSGDFEQALNNVTKAENYTGAENLKNYIQAVIAHKAQDYDKAVELFAKNKEDFKETKKYLADTYKQIEIIAVKDYEYETIDGTVTITKYKGNKTDIVIPKMIDGKKVTHIGKSETEIVDSVFENSSSLTSVIIPDSVTYIGTCAFYNCTALTSVTIPDSVTEIDICAFMDCTAFTSVTIPKNITVIRKSVFGGTALTNLIIPYGVTYISRGAFSRCNSLKSVIIPDSVTEIDGGTFENCTALTCVTIPNSVVQIGYLSWDGAFSGCTALKSATIHNRAAEIVHNTFYDCEALETIYGEKGSTAETFAYENNINFISISETGESYNSADISFNTDFDYKIVDGNVAIIKYKGSKTDIAIPETIDGKRVTEIGSYAFRYCTTLTSVTIPNSVTEIDSGAFEDCTALTSVTIPNSVTRIWGFYSGAFAGCTALKNVTITSSTTEIDSNVFGGCTALETMYGKNGSTAETFAYENNINFVSIAGTGEPHNSADVSNYTDYDYRTDNGTITITKYKGYKNDVVIPKMIDGKKVTTIGESSIEIIKNYNNYDVSSLSEETLIVFENNTSLTNVTIPDSVTHIGVGSFAGCISLRNVTIPKSVTVIDVWSFISCISLTNVTIPNGVTTIGTYAFGYCKALKSVRIPNSVTEIGNDAFAECTALETIYGESGSIAEIYANEHNINFVSTYQ